MGKEVFRILKSSYERNGRIIESTQTGKELDMPTSIYDVLSTGKYLKNGSIIDRIGTIQAAIAGVTDSFNIVDEYSMMNKSILKTFSAIPANGIDAASAFENRYFASVQEYEQFHIIDMERDIKSNDKSIHAYLTTLQGRFRVQCQKDIILNVKRNNISYWIEDYDYVVIEGDKFVLPKGKIIEIL